jgi:hypothetical protein
VAWCRRWYLLSGGAEATVEPGTVRGDFCLPGATRRVRERTDFLFGSACRGRGVLLSFTCVALVCLVLLF